MISGRSSTAITEIAWLAGNSPSPECPESVAVLRLIAASSLFVL
jgi:hypothetical protein